MRIVIAVLLVFVAATAQADESPFLEQARALKGKEGLRMVTLAREVITRVVVDGEIEPRVRIRPTRDPAPFGVFVTLVKRGKVRGCYGSMEPMGKPLDELVVEAAVGAARFDPRSSPVRQDELHRIQVIVSIVGPTVPVLTMSEVDSKRMGLLVRLGDKKSVLLPGEAKTASWQLKRNLRQAGIKPGDSYEMFRFRTVTVYERVMRQR